MILLTWRPASSGWPCTKSCLTNSPRLFSGNSTEPSYQRGSPKLRLVKWPKQRHNLPASLKRHNLDIICETEHLGTYVGANLWPSTGPGTPPPPAALGPAMVRG